MVLCSEKKNLSKEMFYLVVFYHISRQYSNIMICLRECL